jgi:RNA polymerase sigma-70 factor (ECF subfamily)
MKFEDNEDHTEVFLQLLSEHERDIRVYVIAMIGKVSDAEEILQETRLAMWKNFEQFELGTNFKAWGRKVAYHRILAFRTNRSREARRAELSERFYENLNEAVEEVVEEGPKEKKLTECMQKLHKEHRQIIQLRYMEEKSVEEVAEAMRRTLTATYRVISRIRESLRKCINEES